MNDFRLLINGKLVKGASTLDVINPATGRTLTAAPGADLGPTGAGSGRSEDCVPQLVGAAPSATIGAAD